MTSTLLFDGEFAYARMLWQQDRAVDAEGVLRKLLEEQPAREDLNFFLAEVLRSQGRLSAASREIAEYCRASSFKLTICLRAAKFVAECRRHSVAMELCERALAHGETSAELLALAGNIAFELGRFERARDYYLSALKAGIDLESQFVLGAMARTQRYTDPRHPDFKRFRDHLGNLSFSARSRAATGFGLAKAFNDVGDLASATEALRKANGLVHSIAPWEQADWRAYVHARIAQKVARVPHSDKPEFVPVFVIGLPRSGTTLTATRLANRTSVRDRGEQRILRFISTRLIDGGHLEDPSTIKEAAEFYCLHTRQDDAPATWYVDQDPLNFRYLDIVEAMFPQAKIIYCERSRRDTALSMWSQDFAHTDCAFAYDFDDIKRYASGHDLLMEHWRATLSLAIHVVNYEQLIVEPRSVLNAVHAFLGTPPGEDESGIDTCPIDSASGWQARQPIYSTSVGRWRAYLPYIPELTQFPE